MKNTLAKATIMRVDGDVRNHYFNSDKPTLKEMQNIVGGNIELVHLDVSEVMVVNEDGLCKDLPLNQPAINYLCEYGLTEIPIVGDVFVININLID